MKSECEEIFLDLMFPYMSAMNAGESFTKDDWHGVFSGAEGIKAGLKSAGDFAKELQLGPDRIKIIAGLISGAAEQSDQLSSIALRQTSKILHGESTSDKLDTEVEALLKGISGKIRQVIVDGVCACEYGPRISEYQVGRFPKQDKTLKTLRDLSGGYKIVQVHDDGDLTVKTIDQEFVITTEGGMYSSGEKPLTKS